MIDTIVATLVIGFFLLLISILAITLYVDFFPTNKNPEKINWKWQYIYIDFDGGHHRINILHNPDNGFIVAKVVPRPGGLCEAWYQGKLIGEFIRDDGEAEKAIDRRMNLSKLGVK